MAISYFPARVWTRQCPTVVPATSLKFMRLLHDSFHLILGHWGFWLTAGNEQKQSQMKRSCLKSALRIRKSLILRADFHQISEIWKSCLSSSGYLSGWGTFSVAQSNFSHRKILYLLLRLQTGNASLFPTDAAFYSGTSW